MNKFIWNKKIFLLSFAFILLLAFFLYAIIKKNAASDTDSLVLPFSIQEVASFEIPNNLCNIIDFGGIENNQDATTKAINDAITHCSKIGGGKIIIPKGIWLSGSIKLKSNIDLHLENGARVVFSNNPDDYLPVVFGRFEGTELYNFSPLILGDNCENVIISGEGLFDGNGKEWWIWEKTQMAGNSKLQSMAKNNISTSERIFGNAVDSLRPSFLGLTKCQNVILKDFSITNGPMWTIHLLYSDKILVDGINIKTEGANNDGIVIDSSRNVTIKNLSLDTSDDAIAIKSGLDMDGRRIGIPSENIVIQNSDISNANSAIAIGSEMSGGAKNIFASNLNIHETKRGLRLKSMRGRGGIVENIWFEKINMTGIKREAVHLDMNYYSENTLPSESTDLPIFRNIFFRDIKCDEADTAISIQGLEEKNIYNIGFENISLQSKKSSVINNAKNITFKNIDFADKNETMLLINNSEGIKIQDEPCKNSAKCIQKDSLSSVFYE